MTGMQISHTKLFPLLLTARPTIFLSKYVFGLKDLKMGFPKIPLNMHF